MVTDKNKAAASLSLFSCNSFDRQQYFVSPNKLDDDCCDESRTQFCQLCGQSDDMDTHPPTRPDLRLALLTLIFEERGESAMGKQRLPRSLTRSTSLVAVEGRGKLLALSPSLPVDTTQATVFLSRLHRPPRCAKRRPCRRENIIQAWQIHCCSLSVRFSSAEIFHFLFFSRSFIGGAWPATTNSNNRYHQPVHPSLPFLRASPSLLPGFSAPPPIASAAARMMAMTASDCAATRANGQ